MALLAVPPGAAAVVATLSVLTELIVVTLIQLLQTFVHIWGGRVMEAVWPRGLLQGCTLPLHSKASSVQCLIFLMVIAQGCMPALPVLPETQVRKQQAPAPERGRGLGCGFQLSSEYSRPW